MLLWLGWTTLTTSYLREMTILHVSAIHVTRLQILYRVQFSLLSFRADKVNKGYLAEFLTINIKAR